MVPNLQAEITCSCAILGIRKHVCAQVENGDLLLHEKAVEEFD